MKRITLLLAITLFAGCAVNPVTGERDLILMSPSDDLQIGAQNYQPMLQAQGGPYAVSYTHLTLPTS